MTPAATRQRGLVDGRALGLAIALMCAAAVAGALATLAGRPVVSVDAPHDALRDELGTVAALLAHNTRVALWPLALLALGWHRHRLSRWLADTFVAAQLIGHGALVGGALAQHPDLWRYLPHLPLEWLAIALPAAAWLGVRANPRPVTAIGLVALAAGVIALLALAAIVETYLVPL